MKAQFNSPWKWTTNEASTTHQVEMNWSFGFPATQEAEAGRKMAILRVTWASERVQGEPEQLSEILSQTT